MAKKIKILKAVPDNVTHQRYAKGDIIDLGTERNTAAVKNGFAVWADSTEFETAKKEAAKQTEKKEGTPKKTTTTVKGARLETKSKK